MAFSFPEIPGIDRVINFQLIREPMNWGIVWVFASITLLLMHVIMQAFGSLQSTQQAAFNGPGQIAIPNAAANFSTPGLLGQAAAPSNLGTFYGGGLASGDGVWTDGYESKFAEDGWIGNA